jgi:hypothetical protein
MDNRRDVNQTETEIKRLAFLKTQIATWKFGQGRLSYTTLRSVGTYILVTSPAETEWQLGLHATPCWRRLLSCFG